jgi:predicted RNase H-like nuclease
MNFNRFYRDVILPTLIIIVLLISVGSILSANGASIPYSIPEKEALNIYKTAQNVFTNDIEYSNINIDYSNSDFLEKIEKIEAVINSKPDLREIYHGGKPSYSFKTNLEDMVIKRFDTYPDGYIHIERATEKKLPSPKEILDRKEKLAQIIPSRIKKLDERISKLSASSNANDKALLKSAIRTRERLLRQSETNIINIVVTPNNVIKE